MNRLTTSALTASLLVLSLSAIAEMNVPSGKYALENTHGYITFSYKHLGFSNPHVGFDKFDVDLDLNADNPTESSLSVSIDAASINSRVQAFDDHLNADDLFDTANHPTITFVSTSIEALGDNEYKVMGDLSILDVTKPVVLDTTINKTGKNPFSKKPTVGVSATTKVNRSDWGLKYAVPAVGDEVTIWIEVELNQDAGS